MTLDLKSLASDTLARMQSAGFDAAQVEASICEQDELNVAHNDPSLLRSTEDYSLALVGIVQKRRATTTLTELDGKSVADGVASLLERARFAPQDEGNAVSAGQQLHFEQGPQRADREVLARKVEELLAFRRGETPKMTIEEAAAAHRLTRKVVLTSEGSMLSCSVGSYGLQVMGTASEGGKASSFNYTGGRNHDLSDRHACDYFGIADMLRDTERQIQTTPVGGNFTGEVVLAPFAVADLVGWLLEQLGDGALLANASVFKDKVGESIAAPLFTLESHFDAPGCVPYTSDAFAAPPITLVQQGRLGMLLPSLYGSRKTGIAHVPSTSGWRIKPGTTNRTDMIADISKGAIVNRLSMGSPGPNGDFSGVIKNSFLIENGQIGTALSETMVAGNMAQMLKDIVAISSEHLDTGSEDYPWIRIRNLSFS